MQDISVRMQKSRAHVDSRVIHSWSVSAKIEYCYMTKKLTDLFSQVFLPMQNMLWHFGYPNLSNKKQFYKEVV
jgi:hypothetical protein